MKNSIPLLLLCTLLSHLLFGQSQELTTVLEQLSKSIQTVEAKKYSYAQTLTWEGVSPYQVHFDASRTDQKGKSVTLEQFFNLKDIDARTIRRSKTKDLLVIQAYIEDKSKYIKTIEDGEKGKYNNEIQFIANDIDNAREIEKLLKEAIPLAKKIPSNNPLPSDFEGQIKWLSEKIGLAESDDETVEQKINPEDGQPLRLEFERISNGKKETNTENWAFNLIDLNEREIALEVDKKSLYVNVETKEKNNYVRYTKNTKLDKFQKNFKIYTNDIEGGKAIAEVFRLLIAEGKKRYENNKSNTETSLSQLIQDVSTGEDSYQQKFAESDCIVNIEVSYTKKGETITETHKVNLADLDPKSVNIEVSKTSVRVITKVLKKEKLVQILENGTLQKFTNEWSIRVNGIEEARGLLRAIPTAIENCKGNNDCASLTATPASLMADIAKKLGPITMGSTTYLQSLEPVEDNPGQWQYTRTEEKSKKSKEESYIFNLSDLDYKNVELAIGKKALSITIPTIRKEAILKYYVDQTPDDYQKEMEWLADDIEVSRGIMCAMQRAISQSERKEN